MIVVKLTTKEKYERLSPKSQGFIQYWEGRQPGSELKNLKNPYPPSSKAHDEWNKGQQLAVQAAQDSEDD